MEYHIEIRLDGDGFPSVDVLSFRYSLEDEIEDRGIGAVTGAGARMGGMDVWVELADAKRSLPAIHDSSKSSRYRILPG
jgi:hypothetical protein